MTYKLSDRPKWWLPKVVMWIAVLSAVFGAIMAVGSMAMAAFDAMALSGNTSEEDSVVMNLSYIASEAGWAAVGILFYAVVFWMLALGVDKIDQLVWLNASDEDRAEILAKRKKKRIKSNGRNPTASNASSEESV